LTPDRRTLALANDKLGLDPFNRKQSMASAEPKACRVIAFEGSVRSSKTITSLIWWVRFCLNAPKGSTLLMVGVTVDTLIHNLLMPLQSLLGEKRITWNRGLGEAQILGVTVLIMGANDERSTKKIQGLTLYGAYFDEVANAPESFFNMLMSRLSAEGAKLIVTCNPEGPKHWFLVKWLKRAKWWIQKDGTRHLNTEDTLVDGKVKPPLLWMRVTFTLDDNTWLLRVNPEFVAEIKASYSGVFYRRMIEAEWVSADGMVYPEFEEARHVITLAQAPKMERVLVASLDYGQNHDTRGYLLGLGAYWVDQKGRPCWGEREEGMSYVQRHALFVLAEYAPQAAMTVGQHVIGFENFMKANDAWGTPDWIAIDPAALTFKMELFSRGWANVMNAHNAVLPGIQTTQGLMVTGGLFIIGEKCPYLVKGLPGYMWDTKASDRGVTAPLKENDDEADALRYGVYTSRRDWRVLIPLAPINESEALELEAA
jgi:hypothetical protein